MSGAKRSAMASSRSHEELKSNGSGTHHHETESLPRSQVYEVLQMAVDSISVASVALQAMGWLQSTAREFNSLHDSYEQRFGFMAGLECPPYRTHDDYLAYERRAAGLSPGNPVKLLEEALAHTVTVQQRVATFFYSGELASMRQGLHVSEQTWATVHGVLVANMTALKLLVTLSSQAGDLEEMVSRYSVVWKFEGDAADVIGSSQSGMDGLALVSLSLPKLVVDELQINLNSSERAN